MEFRQERGKSMQPDGFGYRARVGLIYIASSVTMEPECYAMAPDGVSIHTARIPLGKVTIEALSGLANEGVDRMLEATRLLAMAPLHSIVFACTSGSFVGGKGYDEQIMAQMREVAPGIPVTTTTTASVKALRAIGARRIVIAAPYTRAVTDRAVAYFGQHGFEVLDSSCLDIDEDHDFGWTPPERVYDQVRRLSRCDADAVFISCTNLRTIAILDALERDLGKPVISATQASFWDGVRLAGVQDGLPQYGRLWSL